MVLVVLVVVWVVLVVALCELRTDHNPQKADSNPGGSAGELRPPALPTLLLKRIPLQDSFREALKSLPCNLGKVGAQSGPHHNSRIYIPIQTPRHYRLVQVGACKFWLAPCNVLSVLNVLSV